MTALHRLQFFAKARLRRVLKFILYIQAAQGLLAHHNNHFSRFSLSSQIRKHRFSEHSELGQHFPKTALLAQARLTSGGSLFYLSLEPDC